MVRLCLRPHHPAASLRIRNVEGGKNFVFFASEQYAVYSKGRPNLKQVLSIMDGVQRLIGCIGMASVPEIGKVPFLPLIAVLAVALLPWILRTRARRRVLAALQDVYSSSQSTPNSNEYNVLLQAREQGWDSERTQKEMAKAMAQNKRK